ncbi:MAG: hypothetical protein LBB68_08610 [Treponema sp.]|jgi:hypothetical protein|nr:hypothetical protein [Treponema sp.]
MKKEFLFLVCIFFSGAAFAGGSVDASLSAGEAAYVKVAPYSDQSGYPGSCAARYHR